ncbi:MAG TPA: plastocyanin/azurin family copper-binding protein [Solirubrobacterales bacterium]|nr:plastocyanin/azurin family copper-binding protein [Solirubrobacterales bacterium]
MRTVAATLLTALALVAIGSTALPAEATAAGECSWQRHSKRVVKHVKRHGRLRRVVRQRHWWTCEAVAAAPSATPTPAQEAPAPLPVVAPETEAEANRLGVRSLEYYFVLSRPTVQAGEVTIELNNQGEDPHNLNLEREGEAGEPQQIPETPSLQRNVAHFQLTPGTYRLWCSLPEHEEKGMQTTLVVE